VSTVSRMSIYSVDVRVLLTWKEDFAIIPAWSIFACLARPTGDVGRRFRLALIIKNVTRKRRKFARCRNLDRCCRYTRCCCCNRVAECRFETDSAAGAKGVAECMSSLQVVLSAWRMWDVRFVDQLLEKVDCRK
jgi:hypothetical protein